MTPLMNLIINQRALLGLTMHALAARLGYPRQALAMINERTDGQRLDIPFFGPVLGFVVNYEPRRAVRFDLECRAMQLLPQAVQTGSAQWTVA